MKVKNIANTTQARPRLELALNSPRAVIQPQRNKNCKKKELIILIKKTYFCAVLAYYIYTYRRKHCITYKQKL